MCIRLYFLRRKISSVVFFGTSHQFSCAHNLAADIISTVEFP